MTDACVSMSFRRTAVRRAASRVGRMETMGDSGDGGSGAMCSQKSE